MSTVNIRSNVCNLFNTLLPHVSNMGAREFRMSVITYTMSEFNVSLACAASHYNFACRSAQLEDPESVQQLKQLLAKESKKDFDCFLNKYVAAESNFYATIRA